LQRGTSPIHEQGLEPLLQRNAAAGRLAFTSDVAAAVNHGTIVFIAVGTPAAEDGSADLQYVLAVAQSIGEHMNDYKLVVNKSTVPVGTADQVRETLAAALRQRAAVLPFAVVSNPEFLKEGVAIDDFMRPDRVIVGCDNDQAALLMRALYAPFLRNRDRLMMMDVRSAELTKYVANAMLATRISFMNEMALLAEKVGADIEQVRVGIGSDSRIGTPFPLRRLRLGRFLLSEGRSGLGPHRGRSRHRAQHVAGDAGHQRPSARSARAPSGGPLWPGPEWLAVCGLGTGIQARHG